MTYNPENSKKTRKTINKPYVTKILINGHEIELILKDALYAEILDELMLLNKVAIDFKLDNLIKILKSKLTTSDDLPKQITIPYKDLDEVCVEDILNNLDKNSNSPDFSDTYNQTDTDTENQDLIEVPASYDDELTDKEDEIMFEEQIEDISYDDDTNLDTNISQSSQKISDTKIDESEKDEDEDEDIEKIVSKASGTNDYLKVYEPKYSFDDVYVDPLYKRRIISALILAKQKDKLYNEWGLIKTLKNARPLVLNFYGPPGTGKSMMAEAIASYLNKSVFLVNYSELESGGSGETAKNIVKCFKRAAKENAVLIFDEADSFLGKRLTNVSTAADYGINITRSVMLIELEKFQGVIIFTTNFISNYDIAFKRRILASIEFKLPDEKGRAHIWSTHIPDELPLSPGITPMALAYKYGGTTGADIKDIVLFAAVNCLEKERERLSWEDFDEAYQAVKNRYSVV